MMVYGIAILALIVSIIGGIAMHDRSIAAAQKAKDEAAVLACQNNQEICKQSNETLVTSCKKIGEQRDEQSKEVLAWKQLADRAATVAQNNLDANKSTLALLSATKRDAQAKAGRPAKAMTCEQTLAEIDADSKEFATARAVMFPPEKAPDAVKVK